MNDFIKGFEKYKQKTSLYPHPDKDHIPSELLHGQRSLKMGQDKKRKEIRDAVKSYIKKIQLARNATKHSQLVFQQMNAIERDS